MHAPPKETLISIETDGGERVSGYLRDAATGPVGVFVHGFRSSCQGERSITLARHAAARDYPWLRFDLRGHGASDGKFADFRLSHAVTDLEAVLNWLGDREIVLVGSSMGGWLAVLAALQHPHQVRGLLLIAPAFNFIQYYFGALPAAELATWRKNGSRVFRDLYSGESFSLEFGIVEDAMRYDVLNAPVRLRCPVDVLHGERDEVIPAAVSREFCRLVSAPHMEVTIVPGGDHCLSEAAPMMCRRVDRLWERTKVLL